MLGPNAYELHDYKGLCFIIMHISWSSIFSVISFTYFELHVKPTQYYSKQINRKIWVLFYLRRYLETI